MMNTWKNQCNYPPGTIIQGKWYNRQYLIIKKLGHGANGVVYLVQGKDGKAALKMGDDSFSMTSEVNVLKAFAKAQGAALGPSLLDVDDWQYGNHLIPFYVMEYIHGPDLLAFIRKQGDSWIGIMIIQLLHILEELHEKGWIFGDLKPDNLIVTGPPARIRCIDVGGTTKEGRAIKEFTEFYDRGYWGLGSRKAERSYDLFSTAMIAIHLAYPNRFSKQGDGLTQLQSSIHSSENLRRLEPVLIKALTGRYIRAVEMKEELLLLLSNEQQIESHNSKKSENKRKGSMMETASILGITSFLYGLYIYLFLL